MQLTLLLSACLLASVARTERLRVQPFAPAVNNEFHTKVPRSSSFAASTNPKDVAVQFAKQLHGLKDTDFVVKNVVPDKYGLTHVYLRQVIKGTEVANADMNINVDNGQILSYGSSFVKVDAPSFTKSRRWENAKSFVKPAEAFKTLAAHLHQDAGKVTEVASLLPNGGVELTGAPFVDGNVKAAPAYIHNEKGELVPTWRMNVKMVDNWFEAHVDADGSKVVSLIDWVADASYNVIKLGDVDPTDGRTVVTNPADAVASAKGWHDQGDKQFTTTQGNNVYAQENFNGTSTYLNNHRPDGGADLVFDNPLDLTKEPKDNIDAAITNLFYWNNVMHDIFYKYGFDEVSGNFQQNNWDKGGAGNDYVIANAQDGSGTNNANFATPPDGQNGRMRMYKFTMTKPGRDGDLENDIPVHEYSHGISNRLTGGPANSNCLGWGEPGGMGEGWGDFFSVALRMKANDVPTKDVGVGVYVVGKTIRKYLYSTNTTTNPTTYNTLNEPGYWEVHAIGEVWANMLYEVYWSLMAATNKYNPDWYSADPTAGNTLVLAIVIEGMKLQPCSPNFLQARDAILQAEKKITGGKYQCAVWQAFAKRGLGAKAVATPKRTGDTSVPDGVCTSTTETPSS